MCMYVLCLQMIMYKSLSGVAVWYYAAVGVLQVLQHYFTYFTVIKNLLALR
jgi:hypothetical protein